MSNCTAVVPGENFLSLDLLAVIIVKLRHHFRCVGGVGTHTITDLVVVGECLNEFLVKHWVVKVVVDQSLSPFVVSEKGLVTREVPSDLLFLVVNRNRSTRVLKQFLARSVTILVVRRRRLGVREEFFEDQGATLVDKGARGACTLVQALGTWRTQLVRFQLLQCS